jgi:hypothetical protein
VARHPFLFEDKPSRRAPLVPVMESTDFRKFDYETKLRRLNGARYRRVFAERQVSARAQVQVDNTTPIILSDEKSVTRGTRGMAAPFGSMKLWLRMGKQYFGAVPKRTATFVTSCRNGCSIRSFAVERARPRYP